VTKTIEFTTSKFIFVTYLLLNKISTELIIVFTEVAVNYVLISKK